MILLDLAGHARTQRADPAQDREQVRQVYRVNQLITIDARSTLPQLQGGRVYFINTQKLAVNQPLTNAATAVST